MSGWNYVDPVEQIHEAQALRAAGQLPQPLPTVQPTEPVQSPLANLNEAIPQIIYGNGDTVPARRDVAADVATGAVLGGLLGWIFARRRAGKQQRVQELEKSLGIQEDA